MVTQSIWLGGLKFKFSGVQLLDGMVVLHLDVAQKVQCVVAFLQSMEITFDLSESIATTDF